jgi:hypothetical protein
MDYSTEVDLTDSFLLRLVALEDLNSESGVSHFKQALGEVNRDKNLYLQLTRHRLEDVFFFKVKETDSFALLPEFALQSLVRNIKLNVTKNLLQWQELKHILLLFAQAKVDCIALKGIALYAGIYRGLPSRYMSDMDFLVEESSLPEIHRILMDRGFLLTKAVHQSSWHARVLEPVLRERFYSKKCRPVRIYFEAHWGLSKGIKVSFLRNKPLWEYRTYAERDGVRFRILRSEDFLMHLCLNAHKNWMLGAFHLVSLFDMLETMRFYQRTFDWEYFHRRVTEEEVGCMVYPFLMWLCEEGFFHLPLSREDKITSSLPMKEREPGNFPTEERRDSEYYIGMIGGIHNIFHRCIFVFTLICPSLSHIRSLYKTNNLVKGYLLHAAEIVRKCKRLLRNILMCG